MTPTTPVLSATQTITTLRRLAAHSTTTCAVQASAYGKCILGTYTDMKKDACKEEFELFGKCLREAVSSNLIKLFLSFL